MKELTLAFNEEEYLVLARMLYLAQWSLRVIDEEDMKVTYKVYDNVCGQGFNELPEYFREMGELNSTQFDISKEMSAAMDAIIGLDEIDVLQQSLPYSLASRDFEELHGYLDVDEILGNNKLLKSLKRLQKKYIDEFEKYGVTHLRLEKR